MEIQLTRPLTNSEVNDLTQVITENTPGIVWAIEYLTDSQVMFTTTGQRNRFELLYIAKHPDDPALPQLESRFMGTLSATIFGMFHSGDNGLSDGLVPLVVIPEGRFESVFQQFRDQLSLMQSAGVI